MTQSNSQDDARSRAAQSHAQPHRGEHGEHGGRSARTLDGAATPKLPAPEGQGRNAPVPLPCGERGSARGNTSPRAAQRAAAHNSSSESSKPRSPHPLRGGIGDTGTARDFPAITIPDPTFWQSKASLLASGLDTVVEAFDIAIPEAMCDRLADYAEAQAAFLAEALLPRRLCMPFRRQQPGTLAAPLAVVRGASPQRWGRASLAPGAKTDRGPRRHRGKAGEGACRNTAGRRSVALWKLEPGGCRSPASKADRGG